MNDKRPNVRRLDFSNFEFEIRFELSALTFDIRFFMCLNPKNAQQKIYHPSHAKSNGEN